MPAPISIAVVDRMRYAQPTMDTHEQYAQFLLPVIVRAQGRTLTAAKVTRSLFLANGPPDKLMEDRGCDMKHETAVPYAKELAVYEQHRAELERRHRGKIAFLHGDELFGVFRTWEKGLAAVLERFGRPEQCYLQTIGEPPHLTPLWGLPPDESGPLREEVPVEVYFAQELATYERHRAELERDHWGEFALIRGDELVGVFKDEGEALAEGHRRFGLEKFMLQDIADRVLFFPLCELPRKPER
jgi:hypothetical protein